MASDAGGSWATEGGGGGISHARTGMLLRPRSLCAAVLCAVVVEACG